MASDGEDDRLSSRDAVDPFRTTDNSAVPRARGQDDGAERETHAAVSRELPAQSLATLAVRGQV